MKRLFFVLAIVACNKPDSTATEAGSPAVASAAPSSAAPFDGKLTGERVLGVKGLVKPGDAWPAAQAKLEARMGKATVVNGKMFQWGVLEGDDCSYVSFEKQNDGTVGSTYAPMKVAKSSSLTGNWNECIIAAGQHMESVEDPHAPGPPDAKKTLGVQEFREGAIKGRSKWSDATVSVKGLFMSTTLLSAGAASDTANVSMTAAKADLKNVVTCVVADPTSLPKLAQYDAVTVKGRVHVKDMASGDIDKMLDVELLDCTLAKSK